MNLTSRTFGALLLALGACGGGGSAGGVTDAGGATDVGGSSSGLFVYVSGGSTISILSLDTATGALSSRGTAAAGRNASYLAFDPGRRWLFATNEQNPGLVVAFSIDRNSGALTRLNETPSGGDSPPHLSVDASGKWVLAANYNSGSVTTLPIGADGRLGAVAGRHLFGAGAKAHLTAIDPANRFVLVPCLGLDQIGQLVFDAGSGALAPNNPPFVATAAAAHPRHLAFHPGGRFVYAINEQANTMDAYRYDAVGGRLTALQTLPTLPPGAGPSNAAAVQVHPSGRFLYGSNRGHNSIVIYALGADGRMTLVGHETGGGMLNMPRSFAIEPGGRYLLAGDQAGTTGVMVFRIDAATGLLTRLGGINPAGTPLYVGAVYLP